MTVDEFMASLTPTEKRLCGPLLAEIDLLRAELAKRAGPVARDVLEARDEILEAVHRFLAHDDAKTLGENIERILARLLCREWSGPSVPADVMEAARRWNAGDDDYPSAFKMSKWVDGLSAAPAEAGRVGDVTRKIIEGCRLVSPHPIGPLAGVGWNEAIDLVLKRLGLDPK